MHMLVHEGQSSSVEMLLNLKICPWPWTLGELPGRTWSVPWGWMVTQCSEKSHFPTTSNVSSPLSRNHALWAESPSLKLSLDCGHASTAFIRCQGPSSLHTGFDGDAWWCPKARLATVPITEPIRLIPSTRKTRTMLTYQLHMPWTQTGN